MMKRRIIALALTVCLIAGCAAALSAFQIIGSLLPLAAQVATQFVTFSHNGTVNAHDQALIEEYATAAQNILSVDIPDAIKAVQNPADTTAIEKIGALLASLQKDSATLEASLQVKNNNTVDFINAFLADLADLVSLLPARTSTATSAAEARASIAVQIKQKLPKASAMKAMFQARLDSLPR